MPNPLTEHIAEQLSAFRKAHSGTTVKLRGKEFVARTLEASGQLAGEQGVPRTGNLNELIADTDPRQFDFDPYDFAPVTTEPPPKVGEYITHNGFAYEITHVAPKTIGGTTAYGDATTVAVTVYALRHVW